MCHVDPPEEEAKNDLSPVVSVAIPAAVLACFVGFSGGLLIGKFDERAYMQRQAIQRDFAMYHPTTGQWMWKVSPPEPPIPPEQLQRPSLEDPNQITVND